MRIMGLDPGSVSFGFSLVDVGKTPRIIKCGMLTNMFHNMTEGWTEEFHLYLLHMEELLRKGRPDYVVAERYVARFRGNEVERVSFMIAGVARIVLEHHSKTKLDMIMASTWKNAINRKFGKKALDPIYKRCHPIPHHPIDATFIALHVAQKFGMPMNVSTINKVCREIPKTFIKFEGMPR